jgi:hypothetical protein
VGSALRRPLCRAGQNAEMGCGMLPGPPTRTRGREAGHTEGISGHQWKKGNDLLFFFIYLLSKIFKIHSNPK